MLLIAGGGAAALFVGLERLGREQLAGHAGLASAAGAALSVFSVMAQRRAVVRLADGPFGPVLASPRLRTAWSAVRVAAVALVPAAAMAAGAVRGGDPEAALAVFGGLALAAALALAVPVFSFDLPFRGERSAPARAAVRTGPPVWVALRSPAAGLPRWAWLGA
ncbi:hypothetical protein H8B08_11525, partial [Caulobacter sp. 17J80-11]|nr:hypothetical protein [Caulobacter sp. 17J80-11]